MKVLFAPKEIAGQVSVLSRALRDLGVPATSLAFAPHKFGYHIDRTVVLGNYPDFFQRLLRLLILLSALFAFDVFHFQYGKTLFISNHDLSVLKLFKKKILMHFHGSEIRNPQYLVAKGKSSSVVPPMMTSEQTSRLNFLRKYVDKFIVSTPDLLKLIPEADYLPNSVSESWFDSYVEFKESKEVFTILHAPTNREIKGTNYIIDACECLKRKGLKIKLLLVEGLPNEKVKEYYSKADVVVDQLLIGWYGVLAIENMAMGNPVVAYIDPGLRKTYATDLPVIQATKETIQDVLESLMKNREGLNRTRPKFHEYALKYHHPVNNAKKLIKIYEQL